MWSITMLWTDLSIIELYMLFSLTTAIVGLIRIYAPIHKKLKDSHTDNLITISPVRSNLIFVILGIITSPLLFVVLMVPSVNHAFMNAMYDSLSTPD
jgi:hypothetical protein